MVVSYQTVGIDIGTSTTSLIIATLTVKNTANGFSLPRLTIVNKQITYRSPVVFTPLVDHTLIDENRLRQFVTNQYQLAKVDKQNLHMGAIIMTGETAHKANADKVIHALSAYAGDFVCATAGPSLESVIAAKSADQTLLAKAPPTDVINLDIGGGTTNLAYFSGGHCLDTACFDIGGRVIRLASDHRITYIAPKVKQLINHLDLPIKLGQVTTPTKLEPLIQQLVLLLENTIGLGKSHPCLTDFITDKALTPIPSPTDITFSGGVADCLYDDPLADPFRFGDIGPLLGRAIRHSRLFTERSVQPTDETIQATVVGAGSHTIMLSGSTIRYTANTLPLKNIPVIAPAQQLTMKNQPAIVSQIIRWQQRFNETVVALALPSFTPSFAVLQQWANVILAGFETAIKHHFPLVIVMQSNAAKALGNALQERLPPDYPLVCLDQIATSTGDYLDIGQPIATGQAVPLIVKTLIFN